MRGLRTQEPTNFINFFELVQKAAAQLGCVFFLDSSDGNERLFGDMEISDLTGWLIPNNLSERFELIWKENNESDEWVEFFRFVEPVIENDTVLVKFEDYDFNLDLISL